MANPEHVEIVKRGATAIGDWRKEHPDEIFDLKEANLSESNLRSANLSGAILSGAGFTNSNLSAANLTAADLSGANLSGADLSWLNLRGAKLTRAHLIRANLRKANLSSADLSKTNLGEAYFIGTDLHRTSFKTALCCATLFTNVDLSNAIGLETIRHDGPSMIGIDTFYKSQGNIPKAFLSGCGVPDALIAYVPSLVGALEAIQFHSCFISYSHVDEEFSKRLHSRLRDKHLRIWFAPEDMKGGDKIHEQIDRAIQVHDKLLLVLSEKSMASEWVATEVYHARQREIKEKRQVLFPIRLVSMEKIKEWKCFDADTGKDMAVEIREYFIPDFSNWKDHDAFEKAFERLLSDLRAAGR